MADKLQKGNGENPNNNFLINPFPILKPFNCLNNNLQNNPNLMNPFINPFILYPNMLQKGNFSGNMILQNDTSTNPNKSYKRADMQNDTDLDNIPIEKDKKEKMVINKAKNKNKDKIEKQEHNNSLNSDSDDEKGFKYNTYVYYDEKEKNKYLFTAHKLSKNKEFIELRCKERKECKGRAKFNLSNEVITITQPCTIKYELHNYVKSEIIREKIHNNSATNEEMNSYEYQKMFFIETFSNYPTLNYNQILISLVKKYEVNKIIYTSNQFSNYKANLKKINLFDKNINERLNDIKLKGNNLLSCFIKYKDIQTQTYKNFRIYSIDLSISLLSSKVINQYFIDTTFKCVSN